MLSLILNLFEFVILLAGTAVLYSCLCRDLENWKKRRAENESMEQQKKSV